MKNKILKILIIILCLLFLNFPISYSITNIKYTFIFIELIALVVLLIRKKKNKKSIINENKYFIIILVLSIITRIGIVLLLNSKVTQYTDFEIALNVAYTGDISDGYHLIFSHWNLYPLIMHLFCNIFGNYQLVTLLFNAVINILICIMIYLIGNKIFDNKKYGFIASIIYIIWPANILYTLILTQEHVGILLILLAVYVFLSSEKHINDKYKKAFLDFILLGIIIGISIFFKNFAYVLFIAFAMYHIGYAISKEKSMNFIKKIIPLYVVMIIMYLIVQSLTYSMLDNIAGRKVSRNLLPYTLNIGLRSDGHWDRKNSYRYRDLAAENNYDFEKTNDTIMSELWDYISQKDSKLRSYSFWDNKAKVIFNEDYGRMTYIVGSIDKSSKTNSFVEKYVTPLNNVFFSIVAFLTALATIYSIFNRNMKLILMMLIIHGSSLIFMLIESQNRYKYPLYSFMCIIAALGIVVLYNLLKDNIIVKKKHVTSSKIKK